MENGRYHIEIEVEPRFPVPDDAHAQHIARLLSLYRPPTVSTSKAERREGGTVVVTMRVQAHSPADALVTVARVIEQAAIDIRREHGADLLGPMPILRRAVITREGG